MNPIRLLCYLLLLLVGWAELWGRVRLSDSQTSVSGITGVSLAISHDGRPCESRAPGDDSSSFASYDALGRLVGAKAAKATQWSQTVYAGARVASTTDASGATASYQYVPAGQPGAGQVAVITAADTSTTRFEYDLQGRVIRVWGTSTTPTEHVYDGFGDLIELVTYRLPVGHAGADSANWPYASQVADETTWERHPATGAVLAKTDALGRQMAVTLDRFGRTLVSSNSRGNLTVYGYSPFGEQTSINYYASLADYQTATLDVNTPSVATTYDRIGRVKTTTNSHSQSTYEYDPVTLRGTGEMLTVDADGDGPLPPVSRSLAYPHDALGRDTGYAVSIPGGAADVSVSYAYDGSGRFGGVAANGIPNLSGQSHAFALAHPTGASPVGTLTGPVHRVVNQYNFNRSTLDQKTNERTVGTPALLSSLGYQFDALGRRDQRDQSGALKAEFHGGLASDARVTQWTYDSLGQLTAEDATGTQADRGFAFDTMGNRIKSATGTTDAATGTIYTANSLNQYETITPPSAAPISPAHDLDGNLTAGLPDSPADSFLYDAENRLILATDAQGTGETRYSYDAAGRRVAKITYPAPGGSATAATLFIHDGWNLVAEYSLHNSSFILHTSYVWGLDISGSPQGAGGVGGLLAVTRHQAQGTTHFYPIYDGNGNIEAYLDSSGVAVAIYQYDAFGNVLTGAGAGDATSQAAFRHQFSTKYHDGETGLLYYGLRYYHPGTGRWMSHEPLGEAESLNLYGFLRNDGVNQIDMLGLSAIDLAREIAMYAGAGTALAMAAASAPISSFDEAALLRLQWSLPSGRTAAGLAGAAATGVCGLYAEDRLGDAGERYAYEQAGMADMARLASHRQSSTGQYATAAALGVAGYGVGKVVVAPALKWAARTKWGQQSVSSLFGKLTQRITGRSPMPASSPGAPKLQVKRVKPVMTKGENGKTLFHNAYPEDTPMYIRRHEIFFDGSKWRYAGAGEQTLTPNGAYNYVVQDGKIFIARAKLGGIGGHVSLSKGNPIEYGGEIRFGHGNTAGLIDNWSNGSGHFLPPASYYGQAVEAGLPWQLFRRVIK